MSKPATLVACVVSALALLGAVPPQTRAAPPGLTLVMPPAETLSRLGINAHVLADLLAKGAASHSDAIVIIKNDEVVGQWYFGKPQVPIEAMSVTKSIAALAIGCLIRDGKIKSLDEPVYDFYPEWNQGRKKLITIRQILNHTSGLQSDSTSGEINASPDFVQLALAAELSSDPGEAFFYNNKAVNLLAGVVQKASGQRLDDYMNARIFAPLGIQDYRWVTDTVGNVQVMAGLRIRALDLAKIGEMLADDGVWHGTRLVDSAWIAEMTAKPGQPLEPGCGLLWWLEHKQTEATVDAGILQAWRQGGVPAVYITRATPLVGKIFPMPELLAKLNVVFDGHDNKLKYLYNHHLQQARVVANGPLIAYNANGSLGQCLVIVPKEHLVAVRQIGEDSFKKKDTDEFADFTEIVPTLVGETVEPQPN